MPKNTVTQVTAFTGLNQSADGFRELKPGEAARAENWMITDGSNIKLRPGIREEASSPGIPAAFWSGYIRDRWYLLSAMQHPEDSCTDISIRYWQGGGFREAMNQTLYHDYGKTVIKVFSLFNQVFVSAGSDIYVVSVEDDGSMYLLQQEAYIPLAVIGASPLGGGENFEQLNILSDFCRIAFSADGEATAYVFPIPTHNIASVTIDNEIVKDAGTYDRAANTFTFTEAPEKGIDNVEFVVELENTDLLTARAKFAHMPYSEAYNGATDSRLFFYGDGSNITYYTGVTEYGRASALYIPAGNEIAVDTSDSPITGATRHYSKLLFYKPDCTVAVTYEPMTLADGNTIAGFTMRTVHKAAGNIPYGQVDIVNNNPRSIANGNLYEWVLPNIYATDERNAQVISSRVCHSLAAADAEKIVTLDDAGETTYYLFLNDDEGTVLVNRYNLGTWTIYKSELFKGVKYARMYSDWACFLREHDGETTLCYLDASYRYDGLLPITAKWYTGYMDFGLDYKRKYSTTIWVSILPQLSSKLFISASTDRRESYNVKEIGANRFNYGAVRYNYWTYASKDSPTIKKVKLKVKKFVYYQLKLEINDPGSTATVLGYDQQIRIGSEVK